MRGGVETLSMKSVGEEEEGVLYFRVPIGGLNVSGIHSTNQMWSDNTKPELKGKKGNEVNEDTSNECVQQISQKNASLQSTMLLLTRRRHALVVSIQLSLSKATQSKSYHIMVDLTLLFSLIPTF